MTVSTDPASAPTAEKPLAVIVDLDGTYALNTSGRAPHDLTRVHEDSVCLPVDAVVAGVGTSIARTVFLSGRQEVAEEPTREWLLTAAGWPLTDYDLFMRSAGDVRPEPVVKRELFDEHIRDHYNVLFVIDNRPSVCRLWRELGLFTFQVGDPHVEF